MLQILNNVFTATEIKATEAYLLKMKFNPAPGFLGNFGYLKFTGERKVDIALRPICKKLADLVPEQKFNTVFIQSYKLGATVNRHRDPRNNTGYTIIAPFGIWTGAESTCELPGGIHKYTAKPGQAVVQTCTINGVQGPYHSVAPVTMGHRFCIILNTIE